MAGRPLPGAEVLAGIRFLLTDVDGVLTDGRLHFDSEGRETKVFHVHDGAGIVYWHRSGGRSGFLSGRGSAIVKQRAAELASLTDAPPEHDSGVRAAYPDADADQSGRRRALAEKLAAQVVSPTFAGSTWTRSSTASRPCSRSCASR